MWSFHSKLTNFQSLALWHARQNSFRNNQDEQILKCKICILIFFCSIIIYCCWEKVVCLCLILFILFNIIVNLMLRLLLENIYIFYLSIQFQNKSMYVLEFLTCIIERMMECIIHDWTCLNMIECFVFCILSVSFSCNWTWYLLWRIIDNIIKSFTDKVFCLQI